MNGALSIGIRENEGDDWKRFYTYPQDFIFMFPPTFLTISSFRHIIDTQIFVP